MYKKDAHAAPKQSKVPIEEFKMYFIALTPKQFEELNRFSPLQSTLSTSATTKAGA